MEPFLLSGGIGCAIAEVAPGLTLRLSRPQVNSGARHNNTTYGQKFDRYFCPPIIGCMMQAIHRGQVIEVYDFKKRILRRVVWDKSINGVLLCTVEAFQVYTVNGAEPVCVGFPIEDIIQSE